MFTVCLSPPAQAQEQVRTVTGTVVDSEDRPVSGVLVFVDVGPGSATTSEVGAFQLDGVTAGAHLLNFRKAGFAPRTFDLEFELNEDGRDIGVIVLEEGRDPTATLASRITDGVSGEPLSNAVVKLNGDVVALTDGNGDFLLSEVPIAWGSNELEVGRFAFLAEIGEFWIVDPDETVDFSAGLDPAPVDVGRVAANVVPTPDVPARLRPFCDRQENSTGQFITRSEIEAREPAVLTDLLRGVSGVRLRPGPLGMEILMLRPLDGILNTTVLGDDLRCASPLIFSDGQFLGGGERYGNLDDLMDPDQAEGIEIYNGDVTIPDEFNRPGSACGVLAVWTR